jgi:hypothetical protein
MTGARRTRVDRRRTWQRRLALGLVAYGGVGIALAVASIVVLGGPVSSLESLVARRADAVRWLDLAETGLADAQQASDGAADSLVAAEASTRSAAGLFRELSMAMAGLREASSISILGTQPLGGLTDDFDRVAGQSGTLADEMGVLSTALAAETVTLDRLADDTSRIRSEVAELRDLVVAGSQSPLPAGGLVALLVLLVAWLALPAAASLAIGIALLRRLSRPERRSRAETAGAW